MRALVTVPQLRLSGRRHSVLDSTDQIMNGLFKKVRLISNQVKQSLFSMSMIPYRQRDVIMQDLVTS